MAKKENLHPYSAGTEHGTISFGKVNTESNEIAACLLESGPDGGRHYVKMQETGSKEDGSKGSTKIICPGTLSGIAGKDIVNYPPGAEQPRDIPAIYYEAVHGDIILTAPRGKVKIAAEAIELVATGTDGRTGVINLNSDDKINLRSQSIDINGTVSTKLFSEKTVEIIGKGIMNVYGGLVDFADRTTKGKPSKFPSINEERNAS
tara:strand:- start:442 stop:1056 length:615 start_codon:yes stop_codon:yes gene_type:complete